MEGLKAQAGVISWRIRGTRFCAGRSHGRPCPPLPGVPTAILVSSLPFQLPDPHQEVRCGRWTLLPLFLCLQGLWAHSWSQFSPCRACSHLLPQQGAFCFRWRAQPPSEEGLRQCLSVISRTAPGQPSIYHVVTPPQSCADCHSAL